jgi:surface antigen
MFQFVKKLITIGKSLLLISIATTAQAGWFGASFSDQETNLAEQAKLVSLTYAPMGVKVMWESKESYAKGYSIIIYDYPLTDSGNCRKWYEYKIDKDNYVVENQAVYCFNRDKGWYGFSRP